MANPFGSAGAGGGNSFTAVPASPPSMSGTTYTQQAYGTAPQVGKKGPFVGTVVSGVAGVLVLLYLYASLPR